MVWFSFNNQLFLTPGKLDFCFNTIDDSAKNREVLLFSSPLFKSEIYLTHSIIFVSGIYGTMMHHVYTFRRETYF